MRYVEASTQNGYTWGNGICIEGTYNPNATDNTTGEPCTNERYTERCIVSGNNIVKCKSCGIKVNKTYDSSIVNNIITRDTDILYPNNTIGIASDYGIYFELKRTELLYRQTHFILID